MLNQVTYIDIICTNPPWCRPHPRHIDTQLHIMNNKITTLLKKQWLHDFKASMIGTHYKELCSRKPLCFQAANFSLRKHAVTLFRLRSGHNRLGAHCKWSARDICPHCVCADTVEHLLLHCSVHAIARDNMLRVVHGVMRHEMRVNLSMLLGSSPCCSYRYPVIATAVVKFIYATGRSV